MDDDDKYNIFRRHSETHPCGRCGNETDDGRKWAIEGEVFYLCTSCNPALYKLIKDWKKLGWTEIPAKEYTA